MASDPATSTSPPVPPVANIRRLAVFVTALMIAGGTLMAKTNGLATPAALLAATIGALAGLAGWWAYHWVSRQSNGLIMIGFSMLPAINRNGQTIDTAVAMGLLIFAVISGLVIGVGTRWWENRRRRARKARRPGPVAPPPPSA